MKTSVIAFMVGECSAMDKKSEAIAFYPCRFMTLQGYLYKEGVLEKRENELDEDKISDVHQLLSQVSVYRPGTNAYIKLDVNKLFEFRDLCEKNNHPFCVDGADELLGSLSVTDDSTGALPGEMGILILTSDEKPSSKAEVFFKLHACSLGERSYTDYNLEEEHSLLENIAWMNDGTVVLSSEANAYLLKQKLLGKFVQPDFIGKFPRMIRYILPSGIEIKEFKDINLGAYLGNCSSIKRDRFVNFDKKLQNN